MICLPFLHIDFLTMVCCTKVGPLLVDINVILPLFAVFVVKNKMSDLVSDRESLSIGMMILIHSDCMLAVLHDQKPRNIIL